jgi:hypothetical protein
MKGWWEEEGLRRVQRRKPKLSGSRKNYEKE